MRIRRWRRKKNMRIVFSHDYYHGLTGIQHLDMIDAMKFKRIRDVLVDEKVVSRKQILVPEMVTYHDMGLVHAGSYIKSIQDPAQVNTLFHLTDDTPWDSAILEYFRIVTGGTLLATEHAVHHRALVFNLGGGFHHAQPDRAAGFCLINDVAIAIHKFRQRNLIRRPMIIDLDYHQGDGNLIIFKDDPGVMTFSMHANPWATVVKANNIDLIVPEKSDGQLYLDILETNLPQSFHVFNPDLVFYIAGSDPYEADTIGDMTLTREEMLKRNLFVTRLVRSGNIPLVVVAGGGYGPDSWLIYYDFIKNTFLDR
jgi:acetoin utilization deacetylase AcuC-like enzyme